MGHARAATFVGSAGRWVASSRACCGPGAAPVAGEWLCVAGVYRFHGAGGASGSGVGWIRGRPPAGSGCRGLTVGRSSAVSPWCVWWWPLVGWLWGVFGVYRINRGTTVCWRAAVGAVVGCGGEALVGVVRVVCGGASCGVVGVSSWRSVVGVRGRWWWAWRFVGGCGTCGVGMVGGGGRVCVGLHRDPCSSFSGRGLPDMSALCSLRGFLFCLSPAPIFLLVRFVSFFWGGRRLVVSGTAFMVLGVAVCACRCRCWWGRACRGGRVAVGLWSAAAVVWCLCGWSRLSGSAWIARLDAGVCVGVFVARAVWVVGTPLLGAGRLVWAWLVLWCPVWAMVWVCFAWVRWGGVPGMCAPEAWWVGLGHCGRCNGWWRCW